MSKSFILFILATLMMSCSGARNFTVDVECESDSHRMLVLTFVDSHNGIQQLNASLDNNRASFIGENPEWTPAYLSWADGEPIVTLIVRNGDRLKIKLPARSDEPVEIKGSKPSLRLADFHSRNKLRRGNPVPDSLNIAIAGYIHNNPDDPVSTYLLTDYFMCVGHEQEADSLLSVIAENARPQSMLRNYGSVNSRILAFKPEKIHSFTLFTATDSFVTIRPGRNKRTLIAVLSAVASERSEQVKQLKKLSQKADSLRWQIIELSFASDSARWRSSIAADTASWLQSWSPGGSAAPPIRRLDIPRQPFFVMIDSAGNQVHRSSSIEAAIDAMSNPIPPKK